VLWGALVAVRIGSTPAVAAAMTFALEPVLVSLLAYAILGERLSTAQIAGGAIVVASVTLVAASPTSWPRSSGASESGSDGVKPANDTQHRTRLSDGWGRAAVDDAFGAGDRGGAVGDQEGDEFGDLFGLGGSSQQDSAEGVHDLL
jgi:hypothetical protein